MLHTSIYRKKITLSILDWTHTPNSHIRTAISLPPVTSHTHVTLAQAFTIAVDTTKLLKKTTAPSKNYINLNLVTSCLLQGKVQFDERRRKRGAPMQGERVCISESVGGVRSREGEV
jgi:hypothetical protein